MTPNTTFDITHELHFDGDLGNIISFDAHGHLSYEDAEVFLAGVIARELAEVGFDACPDFGFEVEHLWRSTRPFLSDDDDDDDDDDERWTYEYTEHEHFGAIPVTRFQIASPWARPAVAPDAPRATRDRHTGAFLEEGVDYFPIVCIHHQDEPAITGIPESQFINPTKAIDGHVHYCAACAADFNERMRVARAKAMARHSARAVVDASEGDTLARAFRFLLRRTDLIRVLDGDDADGSARRALNAFLGAYRAAGGGQHVVVTPNHRALTVTDIAHLVEDYGA